MDTQYANAMTQAETAKAAIGTYGYADIIDALEIATSATDLTQGMANAIAMLKAQANI